MANIVENFMAPTPQGWRKVRNICIILGLFLAWFITTAQTVDGLGIPDIVIKWVGVVMSLNALIITIAQGQGNGATTPTTDKAQMSLFDTPKK